MLSAKRRRAPQGCSRLVPPPGLPTDWRSLCRLAVHDQDHPAAVSDLCRRRIREQGTDVLRAQPREPRIAVRLVARAAAGAHHVSPPESLRRVALEVAAERLLALDRLEQRLEVAVAEAARAVALDHLEEQRRPVLRRLGEDLQQVAVVVAIGEDAQPSKVGVVLVDLADT